MLVQVQDQHGQIFWRTSGGVLSTDTPTDTLKLHSRKQLLVFLLPDSTEYLAPLDAVLDAYQPAETPPVSSGEDLFFVPMGAAAPPPPAGWDKPTPQPHFYLYDQLGNTRVLFHARSGCAESDTIVLDYVGDYYPYGKTLREYIPVGDVRERYLTTQHERDAESGGLDNRGARWYDSDVCRFLSVDPMTVKYPHWAAYNYVMCNPIITLDLDGRDTISINRSSLNEELSDDETHVYNVTYTLIRNGKSVPIDNKNLPKYMFASAYYDTQGNEGADVLTKDAYRLEFAQMSRHAGQSGWENTIRVNKGVFIHPAEGADGWLQGCLSVCSDFKTKSSGEFDKSSQTETQRGLQAIRDLYSQYESALTGDKLILKTNKEMNKQDSPPQNPIPSLPSPSTIDSSDDLVPEYIRRLGDQSGGGGL